jgi:CheY-like chemotaxis protein
VRVGRQAAAVKFFTRASILLVDANAERFKLRRKTLAMGGAGVVVTCDVTAASSVWHRNRYELMLIDIRKDYCGSLARRDEITREAPGNGQSVADILWRGTNDQLSSRRTSAFTTGRITQWRTNEN